jgi:hypothetical protein
VAGSAGGSARESAAPRASGFRRRWTWWRSVEVTVLGTLAPIVPIVLAAAPCRRLRNWDRTVVPRPFARVAIRFGAPIDAAGDVPATRARVQAGMEAALAETERDLARVA